MCATAEFWTGPDKRIDIDALRAFARAHDIHVGDAHETTEGGLHSDLQPLVDGRECCWCWLKAVPADVPDPADVERHLGGLRAVLRWIAERADYVRFEPDSFDYLCKGEERVSPEEVPLPIMGDGRVFCIEKE